MSEITTVGLDLAKRVVSLCGEDAAGRVVVQRTLRREAVLAWFAQRPPCLVGWRRARARTGSRASWPRLGTRADHRAGVRAAVPVVREERCQRRGGDLRGGAPAAAALRGGEERASSRRGWWCIACGRAGRRNARPGSIACAVCCTEFGRVCPNSAAAHWPARGRIGRRDAAAALRTGWRAARTPARTEQQLAECDREIAQDAARRSARAARAVRLSGVGVLTASAVAATVADAHQFRCGRQFAAWLGITPRQYSTGGRPRLGRITRRGDTYLRGLLVQGARSALQAALRVAPARRTRSPRGSSPPTTHRLPQDPGRHRQQACSPALGAAHP